MQRKYELIYLGAEQCNALLTPLGLDKIQYVPKSNIIFLSGAPNLLKKADAVINVIDSPKNYCVENLGPASVVVTLPTNAQIAASLGDISIGTFNNPPGKDAKSRAIIDIHKDSIIAYIPVGYRDPLRKMLISNYAAIDPEKIMQTQKKPTEHLSVKTADVIAESSEAAKDKSEKFTSSPAVTTRIDVKQPDAITGPKSPGRFSSTTVVSLSEMSEPAESGVEDKVNEISPVAKSDDSLPKTVSIAFKPSGDTADDAALKIATDRETPKNGEDLLEMNLPETLTLIQLLDLAGKHLGLNYVYDPKLISNQPIALKLHGELKGQMKVKNLYALLETVLDFMGLAMIRQKENLVAIVPIDRALQTKPEFVDTMTQAVQVGDTVVTRAFSIQYVDIASVTSLLQDMKLSVAVTAFDKADLLFVTCHAARMSRIEQIVNMIDRPGRMMECRFRRLYYTSAGPLIVKIRSLAEELKGITVATTAAASPPASKPTVAPVVPVPKPADTQTVSKKSVYLDIDERTNRILMIGFEEDLTLIEEIIDSLDVAQADTRSAGIYNVKYLEAALAMEKLQKLDILKPAAGNTPGSGADTGNNTLAEQPLVIVLETTNQLLVRAAVDQHARIREFLNYIDVAPESSIGLMAYELKNIKANTAKNILEELNIAGAEALAPTLPAGPNQPVISKGSSNPGRNTADSQASGPKVVVNESTNALLITASAKQHKHIENIINYIDRKTPEEDLSYQIYPLENSSPDHIYNIINDLITETTKDKEDKIVEKPRTQEQITIVADPNTFSLIVYASGKNHEWIGGLINRLDKRRPQVLIDVTLVEITRTDTFEYDLNLVANSTDAVVGNIVIEPIQDVSKGARLEGGFNLLDNDGNPTGQTKAFYSDEKVQALLTAIQQKNYGRVLAKPKILVDDGQEGQIITTDKTTYVKESIQIPQVGSPITTRDFFPIEASIELLITPHISEGNLLKLAVNLSRDDFGTRPQSGAPPDITTSKIKTNVFVLNDNTVILGGLVKLNQSKSGSKVPILGDIPIIGALFRSIDNSDVEKKLYVFLKANIVRPSEEERLGDLQKISEEHREAFERAESEFQKHEDIPGIRPGPMQPENVLKGYK